MTWFSITIWKFNPVSHLVTKVTSLWQPNIRHEHVNIGLGQWDRQSNQVAQVVLDGNWERNWYQPMMNQVVNTTYGCQAYLASTASGIMKEPEKLIRPGVTPASDGAAAITSTCYYTAAVTSTSRFETQLSQATSDQKVWYQWLVRGHGPDQKRHRSQQRHPPTTAA